MTGTRACPGGIWALVMFERYLMPDAIGKTLGDDFYRELKSPEAQMKLREIADELRQADGS
jgi:hypothetical protein